MFLSLPSLIFKTFIPPSTIQLKSTFLSPIPPPQSTLQLDPILLHLQFLSFHFLSFLSLPSSFSLSLVLLSHKYYLQILFSYFLYLQFHTSVSPSSGFPIPYVHMNKSLMYLLFLSFLLFLHLVPTQTIRSIFPYLVSPSPPPPPKILPLSFPTSCSPPPIS